MLLPSLINVYLDFKLKYHHTFYVNNVVCRYTEQQTEIEKLSEVPLEGQNSASASLSFSDLRG